MKLLVGLACAFALAHTYPQDPPIKDTRTTIFAEERLQGEIFENVEAFTNIQLLNDDQRLYRLPNTTKPIHYNVLWDIDINVNKRSYSGRVIIQLVATQPGVNEIVIHSDHNDLRNIHLTQGSTPIDITHNLEPQYQFLRIRPNINLEYNANSHVVYTLSIDFAADMRTDMSGIYESWFKTNIDDVNSDEIR